MDFRNKLVFVPGKPFQRSVMFVGYPIVEDLKGASLR
jgi:hypothetical protein